MVPSGSADSTPLGRDGVTEICGGGVLAVVFFDHRTSAGVVPLVGLNTDGVVRNPLESQRTDA